jgi:hypothetical protein
MENQGPPWGEIRGTLFVSVGTDRRSSASKRPGVYCVLKYPRTFYTDWLLLDSRVVDLPMAYNPIFVTLSSLNPLFFNGLKNEF